jgi:hypothetical protein
MNPSKAAKPASPSAKLMGYLQLVRLRLAKAETGVKSAKEQSRAAKRRRKEAKQSARRAKKQLKQAKAELAEATQALADAEASLAKANERAALMRKRVQSRPASRPKPRPKKQAAAIRRSRRPTAPAPVAAIPPKPDPAKVTQPTPKPAPELGSKQHPISVPRDWEVLPAVTPSTPSSQTDTHTPPQTEQSNPPHDQH